MQDVLGNTVQQIALVAHHDEACPIEFEEGFEPQRRLEIEMVGWLVEQQQVWLGEQQRRKCHTHAPSAGERVERPMLRLLVEAQAGEDARGPRRGAMRIDGVQPVMDLANAMRIGCTLGLVEQARPLGRRGDHGVEGRAPSSRRFLRDVADAHARRHFNRAIVGFIDPGDELQQARLAGPIPPDQTDAGFGRKRGAGEIENDVAAKTQRDAVDSKHGRGPYSDAAACAQTIFCPSIRRLSADVNGCHTKAGSLPRKEQDRARCVQPKATRQRIKKGISMKRIACVITSLVLLPSFAYADQQVRAAWYGNELRGHRTASGEMFNPDGLTVAHKSLPFGTCLVVGNPKTAKTVAVRVNDRGPFVSGFTLDLSSGAARAIGMRSTESVTMRRC